MNYNFIIVIYIYLIEFKYLLCSYIGFYVGLVTVVCATGRSSLGLFRFII